MFTQFREATEPLAAFLAKLFGRSGLVLHGNTPVRERRALIQRFQEDPAVPFFLLSLKAGGGGLNLTAASHVVHCDRWRNPAVEDQATDRAYRIGQHRNVLVPKLVCRGTVEERIDRLIEDKPSLMRGLLEGGGETLLTEMSNEELLAMVSLDLHRLSDISHAEVTQLHGRLQRDRGLHAANRVLALLRTMFNLAKRWGALIADNPAAGVRMFREEKRDGFLNPDELKRALAAIDDEPDSRWKAYFKLALLLGPRRSKLLSARWVDVDLQTCIWRLPMTKAGRSHLLPLPTPAVAILESLPSRGQSEWLFPSTRAASGHLEEPRKAWQRIRSQADVKDVRVHDLRRTLGSWLAANRYGLPLIGRVLNHSQPSATAVYARLDLEPVRAALEANAQAMLGGVAAGEDERRPVAGPGVPRTARPVPGTRTTSSKRARHK